jgi:hypothetical protein
LRSTLCRLISLRNGVVMTMENFRYYVKPYGQSSWVVKDRRDPDWSQVFYGETYEQARYYANRLNTETQRR